MNISQAWWIISIVLGLSGFTSGCSGSDPSSEPLVSDFQPPSGAGDMAGIEGPWARRILTAYSDDGLTWVKSGQVLSDQADVGALVADASGRIYMYYLGWTVGERQNVPAVAISDDDGETWTFHHVEFVGFTGSGYLSDPAVVFRDGIFRMYGTVTEGGMIRTLAYGDSSDGITFSRGGTAFEVDGEQAGVASIYFHEDQWHLLSLASLGGSTVENGTHWTAVSTDGATFERTGSQLFTISGQSYFTGNPFETNAGVRMYVFTPSGMPIRSYFASDGVTFALEATEHLVLDESSGLEDSYVGEPDVIEVSDGRYLMIYSTLIPD